MAEMLLFHHVQGLTDGVAAFADELRAAGHTVHTPDLFDGHTFASIREGFAYSQTVSDLAARADAAADALPSGIVYGGISMGVMSAQRLAQTRPGARGALLYEACVPITGEWAFGPWPDGVAVQIHGKDDDEFFAHEGDLEAARAIVESLGRERAELFTYPGNEHLFADRSLASYDPDAAALLRQRTLEFLSRV